MIIFGLIFLLIFTPLSAGTVQPFPLMVMQLVLLLLFLVSFLKAVHQGRLNIVKTPLTLPLILFSLFILLQLFSFTPSLSTVYFHATKTSLLKFLSLALLFFLLIHHLKSYKELNLFLMTILGMGVLLSFWVIIQRLGSIRYASGPFVNENHLSGYLGMVIPLSLGLFLATFSKIKDSSERNINLFNGPHLLLFFMILIMATGLFLSLSRGGMISFSVSLLFITILLLTRHRIRRKALFIPFLILFLFLGLLWLGINPVLREISTLSKPRLSSTARLTVNKDTLNLIKDYPIFGTGLGTFAYIFPKYKSPSLKKFFSFAHNDYLQLISETGLIGFLILFLGLLAFFIKTLKELSRRHDPYAVFLTVGGLGSLFAILFHSLFDFNLHVGANSFLFFFILGLITVTVRLRFSPVILTPHINHQETGSEQILRFTQAFQAFSTGASNEQKFAKQNDKRLYVRGKNLNRKSQLALSSLSIILFLFLSSAIIRPVLADKYARKPEGLKKAILLDPTNAVYHYQLAKLYLKESKEPDNISNLYLIKSLYQFQRAVRLNPTNSKYHQSLAWQYANLGRMEKARAEFQKAIELEPNNLYRLSAYHLWFPEGK